jgi:fused signal recognition particle receptor
MEYVIIAIVIVVLAAAGVLGYVIPRRRAVEPPRDEAPQPVAETPAVQEESAVAEPTQPAIETPEPTAGRLTRLRSRLSRSQNSLGRGLLALLSRDRLDEDVWEEIEDTLITADVGVASTGEIVSRLRERTRVSGTREPAELRTMLSE